MRVIIFFIKKIKKILISISLTIILISILLNCNVIVANNMSYIQPPIENKQTNPLPHGENVVGMQGAPINNFNSIKNGNNYFWDGVNANSNNYYTEENLLLKYYDDEVRKSKSLNNYYEENYLYSNGEKGISYYDGILTKVIKDFDNDNMLEMALFRMRTTSYDEFSNKEIILEMIKIINGVPTLVDSMVISSEQYLGEEIECDIGVKYVNNRWRIFLNYYERKVREENYESKLVVVEYPNVLNIIATINLSGNDDDYVDTFEFQDEVIDAGININDDTNIYKRAFINDDMQLIPIFTIKRVNEKIKDASVEDYFEQHYDEIWQNGFIKFQYGYTIFVERNSRG